jgi:hypothetical protein
MEGGVLAHLAGSDFSLLFGDGRGEFFGHVEGLL